MNDQKQVSDDFARATIAGSNSLPELAARIRAEHEGCCAALKRGVQHAVAAGKMLLEAKAMLKHGEWLPWLRDHCQIPERSARRYMEVAPYAAGEIGQLADLADLPIPQLPFPAGGTWGEISIWAQSRLDGPFTDDDFETGFVKLKLLHQAQLPAVVSVLLDDVTDNGLRLLRLCSFDDLEAAAIALAPIAKGDRALKIETNTINALTEGATEIRIRATCYLGRVLLEIDHRCARSYTEEDYQREWDETHAAWMAQMKAKAKVRGARGGGDVG